MSDQRIQATEDMVGANHPTLGDTLNRLTLIQHNNDGTHANVTATTATVSGTTTLSGAVNVGGAVTVSGTTALNSTVVVNGNTSLAGTLQVGGGSILTGQVYLGTSNYGTYTANGTSTVAVSVPSINSSAIVHVFPAVGYQSAGSYVTSITGGTGFSVVSPAADVNHYQYLIFYKG